MSFERRHSNRYEVRVPCRIIYDGVQVHGNLINISREGVGIEGSLPFLTPGKTLQIEVDTGKEGDNRFIQVELEVKNNQESSLSKRFGAKLKTLSEQFLSFFDQLVQPQTTHSPFMQAVMSE